MRGILKTTLAFALLTLISVVLFERNPRFKYYLHDDRYTFISDAIFGRHPMDMVFLGSSHTWRAVDTPYINQRHREAAAWNLGASWTGQSLRVIMLRDVLSDQPIHQAVAEFTPCEAGIHPYFKYMATLHDTVEASAFLSRDIHVGDVVTLRLSARQNIETLVSLWTPFPFKGLYGALRSVLGPAASEGSRSFGFLAADGTLPAGRDEAPSQNSEFLKCYDPMALQALSDLADLCASHRVKLYLLYIPARNQPMPSEQTVAGLSRYGKVVVVDMVPLYSAELWSDPWHLNATGARRFTEALLETEIFRKSEDRGLTELSHQ